MDDFPDTHDSQPLDFEAIQFTEALAHSKAFENYLFKNMAQRKATHTMTEDSRPITLSPDNIRTIIPEEIRGIFGDTEATISGLSIFQEETQDLSYTYMQFSVNGDIHTLTSQSDEEHATYKRPNSYGDIVSYELSPDAPLALLAGLVYSREYDAVQAILESRKQSRMKQGEDQPISADVFSMDESSIEFPRIANSDMIERLIMTLGHFEGLSTVETSALLPISDRLLLVSLSQAESPQLGYLSNELHLSFLEDEPKQILGTPFEHLGLSQQLGDIKAFKGVDFNDQIGEASLNERITTIQPEKDSQAWSVLCVQFAETMRTALAPYAHLDETL